MDGGGGWLGRVPLRGGGYGLSGPSPRGVWVLLGST